MGTEEDKRLLEAALYTADHPLAIPDIKTLLGTSSETYVQKLIEELKASYSVAGSPFSLVESERGTITVKLQEGMMDRLGNLVPKARISRGAMKTLAMVAYKEGLTLAKLAELRGSRTYEHVRRLADIGFIESKPHGRTRVLRTSKKFAGYIGVDDDMDRIREWFEERVQ